MKEASFYFLTKLEAMHYILWDTQSQQLKREIQELGLEHVILRYQVGILQKEMATHSSILAWKIPWTEESGRLWSTELQRIGHNWSDSVQFSHSVVSDSLWPHGLQHTRFKLMSIESVMPSSRLILCRPFSSHLQSFPASGSFPMNQLFASSGQSIVFSASASVFAMKIQDWFLLGWTGWISLQSRRFSRVLHDNSKASILRRSAFFIVQLSHPYMTTGKTIPLVYRKTCLLRNLYAAQEATVKWLSTNI